MSDFLSPAINERIKEKNMDFRERAVEIVRGNQKINNNSDFPDEAVDELVYGKKVDAITQLFLDTIEKAKPKPMTVETALGIGWVDNEPEAYNLAVNDFKASLLKEIKK